MMRNQVGYHHEALIGNVLARDSHTTHPMFNNIWDETFKKEIRARVRQVVQVHLRCLLTLSVILTILAFR